MFGGYSPETMGNHGTLSSIACQVQSDSYISPVAVPESQPTGLQEHEGVAGQHGFLDSWMERQSTGPSGGVKKESDRRRISVHDFQVAQQVTVDIGISRIVLQQESFFTMKASWDL